MTQPNAGVCACAWLAASLAESLLLLSPVALAQSVNEPAAVQAPVLAMMSEKLDWTQ